MAGRSKRIDTKVSILLGLHLPLFLGLAQIRDRRPLRYGERQSGYHCVSFANYSQFTEAYCYTCGLFFTGATQGELPEGQEKVPWGIPVSRNSFVWILRTAPTDFTYPSTPTSYLAEPLTLTPTKKENPPGFSLFITPYP